jgi:cullin-associated NEDD8-dissociated protein 1
MGRLIANMGDRLGSAQLNQCLPVLLERLRNEITRLTAVRALTRVAQSPLRVDLAPVLCTDPIAVLAGFLRKNQRALKLSTLSLLDVLVCNYGDRLKNLLRPVLAELPALLSESDLHVAQLTLQLLTSVAKNRPEALAQMLADGQIMPETLRLSQSPLLQGGALAATLEFFRALVAAPGGCGPNSVQMVAMLTTPVVNPPAGVVIHKQGRASTAKCVAAVLATRGGEAAELIKTWCNEIRGGNTQAHQHAFFLLAIGEIGKIQ